MVRGGTHWIHLAVSTWMGAGCALGYAGCASFSAEENPSVDASADANSDGAPDVVQLDAVAVEGGGITSSSGVVPGPRTIRCGAFYCDAAKSEVCCNAFVAGGQCARASDCLTVPGRFACDSRNDCPGNDLCCLRDPGGPAAYSECAADCGNINVPLCETKNQCPLAADECIVPVPTLPNDYKICKGP